MTPFRLSSTSKSRLAGVHNDLAKIVHRAIVLSEIDFCVLEGVRTAKRQEELVKAGASKTTDSRHITGHAVDLGAYVAGEIRWDWPLYYKIATAMKQAASSYGIAMVWGGVWDRRLNELRSDPIDEVAAYVNRRRNMGKKAFIDGPHFELDRRQYPSTLQDLIKK